MVGFSYHFHAAQGAPGTAVTAPRTSEMGYFTGSGPLGAAMQLHGDTSSNGPYSVIVGHTRSPVRGIALGLSDGSSVTATLGGSWFVAWWLGDAGVTSATARTSSGSTSARFSTAPAASAG